MPAVKTDESPGHIGVDVGGGAVKIGLVRGREVVARRSFPTRAERGPKEVLRLVSSTIEDLCPASAPESSVGVGLPGLVLAGHLVMAKNLPGWSNVPVERMMGDALQRRVYAYTDICAMAHAEAATEAVSEEERASPPQATCPFGRMPTAYMSVHPIRLSCQHIIELPSDCATTFGLVWSPFAVQTGNPLFVHWRTPSALTFCA